MKTDNAFSCSRFEEHLRAYVDDELPVNVHADFLGHAAACPACGREMRRMTATRKLLRDLPRVTVSPEFDFRMKLRIRQEHQNAQHPWYALKLTVQDNLGRILAIPAAAVLLVTALAAYDSMAPTGAVPGNPAEAELNAGKGVELVMDENEASDQVNYVLETVTPYDIQQGYFPPQMTGAGNSAVGTQDITLISF